MDNGDVSLFDPATCQNTTDVVTVNLFASAASGALDGCLGLGIPQNRLKKKGANLQDTSEPPSFGG